MHIETLKKVKTLEDSSHLLSVFEQLVSEGYNKTDIIAINGTSLSNPAYLAPILDIERKGLRGHIIVDLKEDKVALCLFSLETQQLNAFSEYKYKSVGLVNPDILLCTHHDSLRRDVFFNDTMVLEGVEDLKVTGVDSLFFLLAEYPNCHTLVCFDCNSYEYYNPSTFEDFVIWLDTKFDAYHSTHNNNANLHALSSIIDEVEQQVFNVEGYVTIESVINTDDKE